MESRVRNGKLIQKLIIASVAAIVAVSISLTVIGGISVTNTYKDMVEEELKLGVEQLNSEMSNVWDGDWAYTDGRVLKGEEDVMVEYEEIMDNLKAQTGIEYSLYYGAERVITTMKDSLVRRLQAIKYLIQLYLMLFQASRNTMFRHNQPEQLRSITAIICLLKTLTAMQ